MIYSIHNDFLTVSAEDLGAELSSIKDRNGVEYLWQGDSKYWSYRAINIFPFVARLFDKKYILDDCEYRMNPHGFARDCIFVCEKISESAMKMEITDTPETYAQYPRHFVFTIEYALNNKTLKVCFKVENMDRKPMYFGLGGHPGFNLPLTPGKKFEDYRLRFEERCMPIKICFDENCFINGESSYDLVDGTTIPLTHRLFDNDAIVLTNVSHTVSLETEGDSPSITVSYPELNYLGLWHWPHKDAPYLCIEPWSSLPSEAGRVTVLEDKKDLITLLPGKIYTNNWTITINN